MRRSFVWVVALLLVLLLVPSASAGKPEGEQLFTLIPGGPPSFEDFSPKGPEDADPCKHVRIVSYKASGFVALGSGFCKNIDCTGLGPGAFSYVENINFNPGQSTATQQGNLTLDFGNGDTISIRFVGRSELTFREGDDPCSPTSQPAVTVSDQPWNITGGTGRFAGVHGNGTRYSEGWITVYSGQIRP